MNCEKIQELLLTDYIDGEMNQSQRTYLESHLGQCPHCLEFARAVKKSVAEPFLETDHAVVPDRVWSNIEESILAQQKGRFWIDLLEKLKITAAIPRPVLAFATVMIVFLAVGSLNQWKTHDRVNAKEQVEYLDSLANLPAELSTMNEDGFGTMVEQYFL